MYEKFFPIGGAAANGEKHSVASVAAAPFLKEGVNETLEFFAISAPLRWII